MKTNISPYPLIELAAFKDVFEGGHEPKYRLWYEGNKATQRALHRLAERGLIAKGHDGQRVIYYYDPSLVEQTEELKAFIHFAQTGTVPTKLIKGQG